MIKFPRRFRFLIDSDFMSHTHLTKTKLSYNFVETWPLDYQFPEGTKMFPEIGKTILDMVKKATKSIQIISFYFELRPKNDPDRGIEAGKLGQEIYDQLLVASQRNVYIQLIANPPNKKMKDDDISDLAKTSPKYIKTAFLDTNKMTEGFEGGICHTKLVLVDNQYCFLGSPNMHWRAFSENVETGIAVIGCSDLNLRLGQIFDHCWRMAQPPKDKTDIKITTKLQEVCTLPIISTSPNIISQATETPKDIDQLLYVINSAQETLCITSYEYRINDHFSKPEIYDSRVQEAIISAAKERNVKVSIIFDKKTFDNPWAKTTLFELISQKGINIKIFGSRQKPQHGADLKVYHSKLAFSKRHLWVSTNNVQTGDFHLCSGIGFTFDSTNESMKTISLSLIHQAQTIFNRYYESSYVFQMETNPVE